jgi:uncharacterized membrane protein
MKSRLKRYLLTGLLVWVPVGVTILVIRLVVNATDKLILLLPDAYRPETLFGFHLHGLGIVIGLVLLLITGVITSNVAGRWLVRQWERILDRIPLVRSVYSSAKQVSETIFGNKGQAFKNAVLVPFPHRGSWAVGLVTNTDPGELRAKGGDDVVNVFIPNAPPTQGFNLLVPRGDLVELEMSVDEALKMVVSLGVIVPKWPTEPKPPEQVAAAADGT